MNIILCAGAFDAISGYNLAIRRLAAEFRKAGHRAVVFCRKPPSAFSADETAGDFFVVPAGDFLRKRRSRLHEKLDAFRPDVVFTHNVDMTDLAGFRYARKRAIPVFSMCHTRYRHYVGLAAGKPFFLSPAGRIFEGWVIRRLKRSTAVFALTEDMKIYFEKLGLSRVEVAGGGVDRALMGEMVEARGETTEPDVVRLLFVGQIKSMKNQIFLLEMSRFLPSSYRLDLVGGKGWDRRYYRKFFKAYRSGRYPNAEWHGELGPAETACFMKKARVFVNASLLEGQSLVQIEALAAGLPTVRLHSARTSGVTGHLKTAVHLDEKTPPRDFAAAVVRLVENDRLYRNLRDRARAEGARYSWKTTADRILASFVKAIGPASGPSSSR